MKQRVLATNTCDGYWVITPMNSNRHIHDLPPTNGHPEGVLGKCSSCNAWFELVVMRDWVLPPYPIWTRIRWWNFRKAACARNAAKQIKAARNADLVR